jgi:hypothetical protein
MKKFTGMMLSVGSLVLAVIVTAPLSRADNPFQDTPAIRQATTTMLQNCKKEFPTEVPGMTINDIDHWAEAQENASVVIATPFNKTQCFAKHEAWEKLVQRNEWTATDVDHSNRLPASKTTTTIDGSRALTWDGNQPNF